eukprot:Nk52_evm4s324 gene=Nk52_evmTU4s324
MYLPEPIPNFLTKLVAMFVLLNVLCWGPFFLFHSIAPFQVVAHVYVEIRVPVEWGGEIKPFWKVWDMVTGADEEKMKEKPLFDINHLVIGLTGYWREDLEDKTSGSSNPGVVESPKCLLNTRKEGGKEVLHPPMAMLDDVGLVSYDYEVDNDMVVYFAKFAILINDGKRLEEHPEEYTIRAFIGSMSSPDSHEQSYTYHGLTFTNFRQVMSSPGGGIFSSVCYHKCNCMGQPYEEGGSGGGQVFTPSELEGGEIKEHMNKRTSQEDKVEFRINVDIQKVFSMYPQKDPPKTE